MSIVGGGGAPNVSGGNPAGSGSTLSYIGGFVFAHSGIIDIGGVQDQEYTLLNFSTSGSSLIKGRFQFYYAENAGEDYIYRIKLNTEVVAAFVADSPSVTNPWVCELIIPPETKIELTAANVTNTNAREHAATLTGRLY